MKQVKLILLAGSLFAVTSAAAQEVGPEEPTFSQAQIEAAFDTCRERA